MEGKYLNHLGCILSRAWFFVHFLNPRNPCKNIFSYYIKQWNQIKIEQELNQINKICWELKQFGPKTENIIKISQVGTGWAKFKQEKNDSCKTQCRNKSGKKGDCLAFIIYHQILYFKFNSQPEQKFPQWKLGEYKLQSQTLEARDGKLNNSSMM